jgi:hypothetical protein
VFRKPVKFVKSKLFRFFRRIFRKELLGFYQADSTVDYKSVAQTFLLILQKKAPDQIDNRTGCEIICFSKDRAIQLHALLASYYDYVENPVKVHVLYTCSDERHSRSYEQLISIFRDRDIDFVYELNFKQDLERILGSFDSSKVFFMTDDALFIDRFNMNDFTRYNPLIAISSLTKGLDLKFCFTYDKQQGLPQFIDSEIEEPGMKCWIWADAAESPDWSYPLSVDGTLFDKTEIEFLIKGIDFKAPNSLEWGLQVYFEFFKYRKGICFEKVKYVNVPCNLVQNECDNKFTGTFGTGQLLDKWESGYRIYYEEYFGKDCTLVQKAKYNFVNR